MVFQVSPFHFASTVATLNLYPATHLVVQSTLRESALISLILSLPKDKYLNYKKKPQAEGKIPKQKTSLRDDYIALNCLEGSINIFLIF